jgi:hypothetical protein
LTLFTVDDRDRAQARVLALADEDERVVAGAIVGSLVTGGDHLSDLDLTFAVAGDVPVGDVLEDWSRVVEVELGGVQLFDLPAGPSIYRVFMLPGCLQFDLSFTPAAEFGATSPRFRLLFGQTGERSFVQPPPARELFGYAVHHMLRARFSIERGRPWLAEYWVSSVRDYALSFACVQHGLPPSYGRGYDDLPADVLALFEPAIPRSLDREELLRALRVAVDGLLGVAGELAAPVEGELRALLEDDALS